ncbi:hypothetical protein EJ110_NYTH44474, partial [Nymphaea thermarum]
VGRQRRRAFSVRQGRSGAFRGLHGTARAVTRGNSRERETLRFIHARLPSPLPLQPALQRNLGLPDRLKKGGVVTSNPQARPRSSPSKSPSQSVADLEEQED